MLFKVYNQNGKVKITKTANYVEQVMFSDVPDGSVVEIEVNSSICTKSHTKKIGANTPDMPDMSGVPVQTAKDRMEGYVKSIRTLEFALANGILDPVEARNAILILKNSVYGATGDMSAE